MEEAKSTWSLEGVLDDLGTDLSNLFWELLADFVMMLAELLHEIPAPEFLSALGAYVGALPPNVLYFLGPFEFPYGFSVLGAAVASRMLLSLIPYLKSAFR